MIAWVAFALVALLASLPALHAHLRAASLLARAAGDTGKLARLYDTPILERNVLLRSQHGSFRARIYRPRDGRPSRGLVLAHGVHYRGIDEPRLIPFARNLARSGLVVMTPELGALADYRVHASSIDELRVAARRLSTDPHVAPGGVTVLGLSFAGGLSLLAAADPSMRDIVRAVVSLGGHHDLHRVTHFLATDQIETPRGVRRMRAHDYGLLVYFYAHAEQFVSPDQLLLFRDALRQTLHHDRAAGERAAKRLGPDARALFLSIDKNDKRALAPLVMRTLPTLRNEMAALSPAGHIEALRSIPVFLLHGAADDVMPPTEAEDNARELAVGGRVELLLSPNIKHVTVEGEPTMLEAWRLLHTLARILAA